MTDLASNRIPSTHGEQRSILDIARDEARAEVWKEAESRVAEAVAKARQEAEEKIACEAKARQEAEARLRALKEELAALRSGRDGPET